MRRRKKGSKHGATLFSSMV